MMHRPSFTLPQLLVLAASPAALAQPSFHGLGTLPMPGGTARLEAAQVSADGSTIIGRVAQSGSSAPDPIFRWTAAGGVQVIGGAFGSNSTYPSGVSGDGSIIVGYTGSPQNRAFRWTQAQGYVELFPPPGEDGASATAVSRDGSVMAGNSYVAGRGNRVVRWNAAGEVEDLGTLPGDAQARISGMSADGSTTVGSSIGSNDTQAFRTNAAGVMFALWPLPGDNGIATAASYDGSTIVGMRRFGTQNLIAFGWSQAGGTQSLGTLPAGGDSHPKCISDDGSIIAGMSGSVSNWEAFLITPSLGMVNLNTYLPQLGIDLSGWSLAAVYSMSADGRTLVGYGIHNGAQESWVATIPAPASILPVIAGLLAARRSRTRSLSPIPQLRDRRHHRRSGDAPRHRVVS